LTVDHRPVIRDRDQLFVEFLGLQKEVTQEAVRPIASRTIKLVVPRTRLGFPRTEKYHVEGRLGFFGYYSYLQTARSPASGD
jgi:hypothetical protein